MTLPGQYCASEPSAQSYQTPSQRCDGRIQPQAGTQAGQVARLALQLNGWIHVPIHTTHKAVKR